MAYILSFLYGASLGSFVNVIVSRLHVAPVLKGRSKCLTCGNKIEWFDLIPVISYLVLAGKCRSCKHRFGIDNLFVELIFGAVFVLVYMYILRGQPSGLVLGAWLMYYSVLFVSLGVMGLYDLKHRYIPATFFALFLLLSFLMLVLRYTHDMSYVVLLGPLVVAFPFLLIWLLSKGRALGFGDVILYAGVGAFFGIEQGLAVLLVSIWMGALIGIGVYFVRRRHGNMTTAIPFVPYIVVAFLVVLFTDIDIFSIASLFS